MFRGRPRCQDEWWVFTEPDDGGSHCEEQRTGHVHCVMFHLRLEESKHHLRTTGPTPAQQTPLSMSNILTWNVRDLPVANTSYTCLHCCPACWNDTVRQSSICLMFSLLPANILLYLQRLRVHLSKQAHNLHCYASPRQVAINSTRARHYRLSHAALSIMLQTTYTRLCANL